MERPVPPRSVHGPHRGAGRKDACGPGVSGPGRELRGTAVEPGGHRGVPEVVGPRPAAGGGPRSSGRRLWRCGAGHAGLVRRTTSFLPGSERRFQRRVVRGHAQPQNEGREPDRHEPGALSCRQHHLPGAQQPHSADAPGTCSGLSRVQVRRCRADAPALRGQPDEPVVTAQREQDGGARPGRSPRSRAERSSPHAARGLVIDGVTGERDVREWLRWRVRNDSLDTDGVTHRHGRADDVSRRVFRQKDARPFGSTVVTMRRNGRPEATSPRPLGCRKRAITSRSVMPLIR